MKLRRTTEDYLKTIYILSKTGEVHGAAIAERLGVSRPTVSISLKALKQEGYIIQDDSSAVWLTEATMTEQRNLSKNPMEKTPGFYIKGWKAMTGFLKTRTGPLRWLPETILCSPTMMILWLPMLYMKS